MLFLQRPEGDAAAVQPDRSTVIGDLPKIPDPAGSQDPGRLWLAGLDATSSEALSGIPAAHALFGDTPPLSRLLQIASTSSANIDEFLAAAYRLQRSRKHAAGLQLLLGHTPVAQAGRIYSDLADAVLTAVARMGEAEFVKQHGHIRSGRHAVVSLGKLGSRELTASSDLDLLFVYELDDQAPPSDGAEPLAGCHYYGRLAKTLIAALGCNFGDGALFEVDFRLRPWGSKGPIATRLTTLRDYFADEAWTYEALALTRARFIAGSPRFAPDVMATIRRAICASRARHDVNADILEMRLLVQRQKASRRAWDIKHVAGGLMDAEFIVQGLSVAYAETFEHVPMNCTSSTIAVLAGTGRLTRADAQTLADAIDLYHAAMQLLRVAGPVAHNPRTMPDDVARSLARATGNADIGELQAKLREAQRKVRGIFDTVFGSSRKATNR